MQMNKEKEFNRKFKIKIVRKNEIEISIRSNVCTIIPTKQNNLAKFFQSNQSTDIQKGK